MTDQQKKDRRDRIQRVAEHKRRLTIWLTRDRFADGAVSVHVDVWLLKPERVRVADGSAYYRLRQGPDAQVKTGEGPKPAHHGTWSIAQCLREVRTYPDDDLMMIRAGDDQEPPLYTEEEVS